MIFFRTRQVLKRKILENYNYYKVLYHSSKTPETEKAIFVDASEIAINRYLYNFLKFFHLNNYTVFLPKNKQIICELCKHKGEFEYASWLIEEGIVKFISENKFHGDIKLNKKQLSNDYFSSFFKNDFHKDTYHVPMSEFPGIYHNSNWTVKFENDLKRKQSVFMVGNIDRTYYENISKENIFDIPSRRAVADFIYNKEYYEKISSVLDIEKFIQSELDNRVLLIDTFSNFEISGDQLKRILIKFDFYLALPGIIIPQSHNVIEAMSAGCTPILHITYANLFRPVLQHNLNCLVYETLEELDKILYELSNIEKKQIINLRKNVVAYYNEYLAPTAVVKKIKENDFSKIYIQAEERSIYELQNNSW
jgi:hypothetical protein